MANNQTTQQPVKKTNSYLSSVEHKVFTHTKTLIAFFVLIALFFLHRESYDQMPISKHIWAQTDWYALSIGFVNNGMDLFHPENFQLNLQFPSHMPDAQLSGITAADFPLVPYLSAAIMKLTHSESPIIFRTLAMLLSCIGLYCLFLTVYQNTGRRLIALAVMSMVAFQPIFSYYMNGFIPTPNAIALLLIGIYYLNRYLTSGRLSRFVWGIFFLTLSALVRFPFIMPILAIVCTLLVVRFISNQWYWKELLIAMASIGVVMTYFVYNQLLANEYGTLFLNHWLPATSLSDFVDQIISALQSYIFNFFTIPTMLLFGLLLYWVITDWAPKVKTISHPAHVYSWLTRQWQLEKSKTTFFILMVISMMGACTYFVLMIKQFTAHDYYYLDTFGGPLILFVIYITRYHAIRFQSSTKLALLIYIVASLQIGIDWQRRMYDTSYMGQSEIYTQFSNTRPLLDSLNIAPHQPVAVLPAQGAPGLPFLLMKQKGYRTLRNKINEIDDVVQRPFDVLIVPKLQLQTLQKAYPLFNTKFKLWHKSEHLLFFKKI